MSTATAEPEQQVEEERDLKREHYERIIDLQKRVRDSGAQADIDKEIATSSKKHFESLQKRLNQLIANGPQGLLPLEEQETVPVEAWEEVPIGDVLTELTDSQKEKLEEAGAQTVGEFEKLRAGKNKDYPRGLLDLPRVGEALVTKWENQMIEWLATNQPGESEEETESEDS